MPRVLHILSTAQPAATGIVRLVSAIGRSLRKDGYGAEAWFLLDDGPLAGELLDAGLRVHYLPWLKGPRDPTSAWRFWNRLRQEKFSIVHQHFGGPVIRWVTRRASESKIILHAHGRVAETAHPVPIPISSWGADTVIAVSKAVASSVVGATARVIYPGITVPQAMKPAMARPELVIGTAARLIPLKGIIYLVRAVAALAPEFPNIRLEIAGAGCDEITIRETASALRISDRVKILGWQTDLGPALSRWDIYAQPSLEEAFCIATAEAMAAGLPVVASQVGGLPEVMQHEKTGFLVPPADEAALAQRLKQLLSSPELRCRLGRAGRERVRCCFSAERMAAEVGEVYDSLLRPGSSER